MIKAIETNYEPDEKIAIHENAVRQLMEIMGSGLGILKLIVKMSKPDPVLLLVTQASGPCDR
jgi:hypothetical protein